MRPNCERIHCEVRSQSAALVGNLTGITGESGARGGEGLTPSPHKGRQDGKSRNPSGLERETGLEPATPCLEGRYLHFHRLEAANPFESSTSHRSTSYGRKHGSC